MIVIFGLVILIAATLVGLAGVLANGGSNHALTDNFAVFGYHVTGSTGLLFLYGIVVGGAGLAGLVLVLAGARATARREAAARRELAASHRELEASRRHANTALPEPIPPIEPPARTNDPGAVTRPVSNGPSAPFDPAPDYPREGHRR